MRDERAHGRWREVWGARPGVLYNSTTHTLLTRIQRRLPTNPGLLGSVVALCTQEEKNVASSATEGFLMTCFFPQLSPWPFLNSESPWGPMLQPPGSWSPSITFPSWSLRSPFGQTRVMASSYTAMTQPAKTSCLSTWQGATWSSALTVALGLVFSGKGWDLQAPPPPKLNSSHLEKRGLCPNSLCSSCLPSTPTFSEICPGVYRWHASLMAHAFLLARCPFLQ